MDIRQQAKYGGTTYHPAVINCVGVPLPIALAKASSALPIGVLF